jgi:hypothetical protein
MFFSRSMPNLTMVIPAMDHIDTTFTNCIINKARLQPAIRTALGLAKKTLNRYYSLTDSSNVYRIAMGMFFFHSFKLTNILGATVLHPRHKLQYFKQAGWQAEWITTAEALVRNQYTTSYRSHGIPPDGALNDGDDSSSAHQVCEHT